MRIRDPHRLVYERSLAYHRAVAERLLADPSLVQNAQQRVREWLASGTVASPYASHWRALLDLPLADLVVEIVQPGETAHDLRQVSPFAGVLDARTRWRIHRAVREMLDEELR